MPTEQMFVDWFMQHPFLHSLALAVVGAVSASVKHDYSDFQKAKTADPNATFGIVVALRKYSIGAGIAAGTILSGELFHILGMS